LFTDGGGGNEGAKPKVERNYDDAPFEHRPLKNGAELLNEPATSPVNQDDGKNRRK
jgi:hypothetical protein